MPVFPVVSSTIGPFLAACERSNAAMVAALLNHGAAVNTHCILGWTALQEAVCRNNVEICDMLLKAGAKHNLTNVYGIAPLFSAAQSGQLAALRFLLKHGGYQRNTGHSSTKNYFTQAQVGPG